MDDKAGLNARLIMRPVTAAPVLTAVPMMTVAASEADYSMGDRTSPNSLRKVSVSTYPNISAF